MPQTDIVRYSFLIIFLLFTFFPNAVHADIPPVMSYQGKVTDADGDPVADGSYDMQFKIYNAVSGGTELWDSGLQPIDINSGIFNVLLGESPQPAIGLDFNEDYWLEVTVESDVQTPRTKLGSVGYAFMASGLVPGTVVEGNVDCAISGISTKTSGVCYGAYFETTAPQGTGVRGWATATSGVTYGVYGRSFSTTDDARGIYGRSVAITGMTYGVFGLSDSNDGTGVYGEAPKYGIHGKATAGTGAAIGVHGISESTAGIGVFGHTPATSGYTYAGKFEDYSSNGVGVAGWALATTGSAYGIDGFSGSTNGRGVHGRAVATTGETYGGYFETASTSGRAVFGEATATAGTTYGGRFETPSTSGRACYGWATATSGETYGGVFKSDSPDGYGVWAKASATAGENIAGYFETSSSGGRGVMGIASATSADPWGVYGRSSGSNGIGVNGAAWSTEGEAYGGSFYSHSPNGAGIRATATATTGTPFGGEFYANHPTQGAAIKAEAPAFGVHSTSTATSGTAFGGWFKSASTAGRAVHGTATATTGENYGGYFSSASESGVGVYGRAINSAEPTEYTIGVLGEAHLGGGLATGVLGKGTTGIWGQGQTYGGAFDNDDTGSNALTGWGSYKISGTGSVSFIQNHPTQNDRVIVYACPEGDEVATYTRGTAQLKNGEAVVDLGETFKWVTNPETGLTAHITPRGEWADLYVKSVTTEELVVASRDGTGDTRFDYMVYGLRIGFEDVSIVQEKTRESYIPAMSFHEEQYAKHPDLRRYSAKSRFAAMESRVDATQPGTMGAAQSLLGKIGMYDPAFHSNQNMLQTPSAYSGTTLTGD